MTSHHIEFGLDTPVYVTVDDDGRPLTGDVVIRNTVEEAVLADAVGIDSFNIGEHYRPELMDSAGAVMLGAIAGRTERIRLGTAVTVLSTQDPVRVYTEFATLDAVSNGRAQLIVGRGSLTDSFPLFGFDLADYEKLFEENLDLLTHLLRDQPVTWSGSSRSPLTAQHVSPPLPEGHLPTWVGVGGSPQSVMRAARYGLPLMLAIIGGHPSRFAPYVELYKRALEEYGHPQLPVGMHSGRRFGGDAEAVALEVRVDRRLRDVDEGRQSRGAAVDLTGGNGRRYTSAPSIPSRGRAAASGLRARPGFVVDYGEVDRITGRERRGAASRRVRSQPSGGGMPILGVDVPSTSAATIRFVSQEPRRHHYVPQWYLRRFASDGKVAVFDLQAGRLRLQSPRSVALVDGLYDIDHAELPRTDDHRTATEQHRVPRRPRTAAGRARLGP